MIEINKGLLDELFEKARASDRLRMNYDLRTSANDGSQRMLNALLPGTCVPIHRHPSSNENVICLKGRLVEVIYEEDSPTPLKGETELLRGGFEAEVAMSHGKVLREKERITLDPSAGAFGCVVPAGAWHTVEVLEPSVIYEAKDGKYGEDGSETWDEYILRQSSGTENAQSSSQSSTPESCLGDLRSQITYLIGMERQSGSMDAISPLYVSRMLNVPLEEVEKCMMELSL